MKRLTKKAWFGPKKWIGWGWSPVSWEGWMVILVYIVLAAWVFPGFSRSETGTGTIIGLTFALIIVVILTGDKPGGPKWYHKDK